MPAMPTIRLKQPLRAARVVEAMELRMAEGGWRKEPVTANPQSEIRHPQLEPAQNALQEQQAELARLLEVVNTLAAGLHQLQEQTLVNNRSEIARLAVEIARRILKYKLAQGDYDIQAIVEEALQQAPTRQNAILRLHPEDLPLCQQLQRANPDSSLAELELLADGSVGRGECLVETSKGIVKSFIEEHLDRISEALRRVE